MKHTAAWGLIVTYCALWACTPPSPLRETGCLEPPAGSGRVVARVGDVAITSERLEERVKWQAGARHGIETEAALRALVEDEVRFELLARSAYDRGLWRDPAVIDAARQAMVRKLLETDLGDAAASGPPQGPSARSQAFQKYIEQLRETYPVAIYADVMQSILAQWAGKNP